MKTIQGLHIIGLQKRIGQGERRVVVKNVWHRIPESIILLQHPSITSTRSNIFYWILNHLISQTLVHFYIFLPCLARPCCFLSVPPSCNHDSSVKGLMGRSLSARDLCSFWRRSINGSVSIHHNPVKDSHVPAKVDVEECRRCDFFIPQLCKPWAFASHSCHGRPNWNCVNNSWAAAPVLVCLPANCLKRPAWTSVSGTIRPLDLFIPQIL